MPLLPPSAPDVRVSTRPLVVTADPLLLDDLVRLAAAAGTEVDVAPDASSARRSWGRAPLVLAGRDATDGLAALRLPRRPGVVLVGADPDDATVWERAVAIGAEQVAVLPDAEEWLVRRLAEPGDGRDSGVVVGVIGGRGGAGASTTATALALTAVRSGAGVVLLDGDPLGGGLDLLLGGEDAPGLRWADLTAARGHVGGAALSDALPRVGAMSVLSCDREGLREIPLEAMDAVLAASRRAFDLVVVDLPRHLDAATELVLSASTRALLVVPAEVRATAAASAVAAVAAPVAPDLRVLVRGPAPSGLPADLVAEAIGLPLAGSVREEPGLAAALERGDPPGRRGRGPLAEFCAGFLADLELPRQAAA